MGLNYLAEIVFPICLFSELETKQQCFKEFLGTGFFIGTKGFFISARHVLPRDKVKNIEEKDSIQILPRMLVGEKTRFNPMRILELEAAPDDFDLVVGKTEYKPEVFLILIKMENLMVGKMLCLLDTLIVFTEKTNPVSRFLTRVF